MYLKTPEWKRIATTCKSLVGNKCSRCGSSSNLHAHHLTYERITEELQEDLECLCSICHAKEHDNPTLATKRIRGGFNMIYHKNYEDVMEKVVSSNKELKLFNWIINQFTYMKTEVSLSYLDVDFISRPQFVKMVKSLVELQCLKRVKRGIYRLNPFMYLPFRADGEELQAEWNQLQEHNNDK